jgi:hypothetical protein
MKLKSNLISVFVILSFLYGGSNLQAQGIYSAKSSQTASTTSQSTTNSGGLFRADPNDPFGDGGSDGDPAPGEDSTPDPIGEGILILSLLSGAYAFVKRNVRKKYEE